MFFMLKSITAQTSNKFAAAGGFRDRVLLRDFFFFFIYLTPKLSNLVPEKDLKTA